MNPTTVMTTMAATTPAAIAGGLWGLLLRARARGYARGWLARERLSRPVIGIGALSMGGTGKTPCTQALAKMLTDRGVSVAILSRGYGRDGKLPLVVSDGRQPAPAVDIRRSGDEPGWLAHVLPNVAVAVARRRVDAAGVLEKASEGTLQRPPPRAPDRPAAFLLDDGFQHLRLERDVDLLVVDADAPYWKDQLPPGGRLREPHSAAERAHAVLLVGRSLEAAQAELRVRLPGRPVFVLQSRPPAAWSLSDFHKPAADRPPAAAVPTSDGTECGPSTPGQGPTFAFAGIANPQRFWRSLRAAGVELVGRRAFADHHWYRADDLVTLQREAVTCGAVQLVTTEKDAMRLAPLPPPELLTWVWRHRLRPTDPAALGDWLLEHIDLAAHGVAS